jgi:3-hydroxymyristoyl/3-hydroxydecanoyl-(acyl carrier protein) dehydratase
MGDEFELSAPERDGSDAGRASFRVLIPRGLKYLDGHFPGRPIVPGIAQLALIERAARTAWPDLVAPTGLRRLKFQKELLPGDALIVELDRAGDDVRFVIQQHEAEASRGLMAFASGASRVQ